MQGTTAAKRRWAAAAAGASLLVLAACAAPVPGLVEPAAGPVQGGGADPTDGPDSTDGPDGGSGAVALPEGLSDELTEFYEQDLDWQDCGGNECAQLTVPVDYQDPTGATLEVELTRVPAQGERVGSLVINPGGPGGSGIEYAQFAPSIFGDRVVQGYDIVGFDPRGVGASSPVSCIDDASMDRFIEASTGRIDEPDPDLPEVLDEFVQGCQDNAGDLAPHVSTIEVARDMDVLRAALGEETLDYYGASYGTFIGTTYANLYPDQVGQFVLDAGVAPTVTGMDRGLAQAEGFERAVTAYAEACVADGDCPLGETAEEAKEAIPAFLADLSENPLPLSGDAVPELTDAWAFWAIIVVMYDDSVWFMLDNALEAAIEDDDGSQLMFLANAYFSRNADGSYASNSSQAIYAVNCLDAAGGDTDPAEELSDEELLAAYEEVSPTWGAYFVGMSPCEQWPYTPVETIADYSAPGTPPIVVVGTTRDPATPIEWSQELADLLDQGVLLTWDGDGHGAYGRSNDCIEDAVDSFLLDGTVPAEGTVC